MMKYTTKKHPSRWGIIMAYFLIYVVWGSTYYFIGVALKGFSPFLLGGLRFGIAGLFLLSFSGFRGENIFKIRMVRKSAICGIVLLFIDMAVIMLAQKYLSSSLIAILASSTAIWIMALDAPMWKINFSRPAIVTGIIAGFLGVMLLFVEQLYKSGEAVHGEYGILLLMFGCLSWSLGTLYAKYKSSSEEMLNDFSGAAWQMIFAGGMFWICSFLTQETENVRWDMIQAPAWFSLIYLILFGSILAYTSYIWLLKVRPATEVGTHAYANPLVAVLLGTLLGDEEISWVQISGLGIILSSIALIGKKSHKYRGESYP